MRDSLQDAIATVHTLEQWERFVARTITRLDKLYEAETSHPL